MLIAFSIIVLITITSLSVGIYALFLPFMQNIASMQAYDTAYYGAVAATERALLVTREQGFGFNGSGWRQGNTSRWPISDQKTSDMGVLANDENGIQRTIQWQTTRIPAQWQGNVPTAVAATDSSGYNTFVVDQTLTIKTKINNTINTNNFYGTGERLIGKFLGTELTTQRRLPPYIKAFRGWWSPGLLDNEVFDDIIIARQRSWTADTEPFTILPTTSITENESGISVNPERDINIRENIINNEGEGQAPLIRFTNSFNPLTTNLLPTTNLTGHTTTWVWGALVVQMTFQSLFASAFIDNLQLQYNMIQTATRRDGKIYPFLEYYIQADQPISDTYRHIVWQWRVQWYQVQIHIKKPQTNI